MVDTTGAATGERRSERLELRVPASRTQLPAVRAMAGDLAMRMDFDLDAVEDLRLAVDEASATLAAVWVPSGAANGSVESWTTDQAPAAAPSLESVAACSRAKLSWP